MNNQIERKLDQEAFKTATQKLVDDRNIPEMEAKEYLKKLGPKQLSRMKLFDPVTGGWREGFTKKPIQVRKENNRKKNKAARIARRKNR